MPRVTLSLEQVRAGDLSQANINQLFAAGATLRPHTDYLDGVPVGLARKALRARRAYRRAMRLSGWQPRPSRVFIATRKAREQDRADAAALTARTMP